MLKKIYREHERTGADVCGRNAGRNRAVSRGDDIDIGRKFHPVFGVCIVWIEWKCVDKSY